MAKKFVVHVLRRQPGWMDRPRMLARQLLPILVAIPMARYLKNHMHMEAVVIAVGVILFVGIFRRSGFDERLEVSLTVNNSTVQISKSNKGKQIGNPVSIQRNNILDVVVNEVVLSHKVVSVIVIRLYKSPGHDENNVPNTSQMQSLLMDGNVKLQLAFPGVEMSYMECMAMRREICRALIL